MSQQSVFHACKYYENYRRTKVNRASPFLKSVWSCVDDYKIPINT